MKEDINEQENERSSNSSQKENSRENQNQEESGQPGIVVPRTAGTVQDSGIQTKNSVSGSNFDGQVEPS